MLRALLFDLDNTLIDRDRAFRDCVCQHFPDATVREELLRLDARGHGDREVLFAGWHRHGGMALDQRRLGGLIAERLKPDAGLLSVLQELSKRWKLGIITNGSGDGQRRKWSAAGLRAIIPHDRVWVSGEVGLAKPDPGIFLLASRTLGEVPGNCLYVGDYEPHDRAGATAAGMPSRIVEGVLTAEQLKALVVKERGA
jgi:putative hydrolase of the HAD superfamily